MQFHTTIIIHKIDFPGIQSCTPFPRQRLGTRNPCEQYNLRIPFPIATNLSFQCFIFTKHLKHCNTVHENHQVYSKIQHLHILYLSYLLNTLEIQDSMVTPVNSFANSRDVTTPRLCSDNLITQSKKAENTNLVNDKGQM